MTELTVRHSTVYSYPRTVRFGEHRLMFRPRDSHDLRLLSTKLTISPPAEVRWIHDVFGNSIAVASFKEGAEVLSLVSEIIVETYAMQEPEFRLEPWARTVPFSYAKDEIPDLARTIERHYPDPDGLVQAWVRTVIREAGAEQTNEILNAINQAIKARFIYSTRWAMGIQTPVETLELGSGSCRDYALLMMEACRNLGLAARFVTGYLYDPALDGASESMVGAGSTHAWMQVYLPGAGWIEFDPTNGTRGSSNLIRVGVARDPAQAIPVQGSYYGDPVVANMDIDVRVSCLPEAASVA